jgi:PST family polysaccharide transporter
MTLFKTSVLTALSTLVTLFSTFMINKALAIVVGPLGLAAVGQLKDFIAMLITFSNGAMTHGIVKYTAESKTLEQKQKIFSTTIVVSLICSSLISLFLFIFSDYLSELILKDPKYSTVFMLFGITIYLFSLNSVFIAILNGQKEIKKYITITITGTLLSLILTLFLIIALNLKGALYAFVLNQSVIFFITFISILKSHWFRVEYFTGGVDRESLVKLSKYSLMTLTSISTVTLSHLIIRNYIGENVGWIYAGYWQGMWYISTIYLLLITTLLNIYYLPKLSEIEDKIELKKEIFKGYKTILPIAILLSFSIYELREQVVLIAFSEKFVPMIELFAWQLIGDMLRIASWILGYITIAKAMTKSFIVLEIVGNFNFALLSIFFIDRFGLVGVTYAYTLNYLIFMGLVIFLSKRYFND